MDALSASSGELRDALAEIPAPAEMFARLARAPDAATRRAAAENPNTPPASLVALAADPIRYVRRAVAAHPNTPPATLERLLGDEDESVREAAARTRAAF